MRYKLKISSWEWRDYRPWIVRISSLAFVFAIGANVAMAERLPPIRVALDDVPGVDMLNVLTAIEAARHRGLDITVEYLRSEDIAAQAILLGQADVGMGTPYAIIQNSDAPVRMVYQLNTLRFFPVVNSDYYQSWKDLDGAEVYSHGRGSGTEAIMNLMARKHGIQFGKMHYLPGSGVRARAMLQGRIRASIVDSSRRNLLREKGQDRFLFLPSTDLRASDETLYVRQDFLEQNGAAIEILLEELLKVWRRTNEDPNHMVEAWKRLDLLPASSSGDEKEVRRYYTEMVEVDAFPSDGGGLAAVKADFEFYTFSGTLKGDPGVLAVEDFWDLGPLTRARSRLDEGR